ncbi:hypothetical protein ACWD5V_09580 [Streptomyces sp. NPDC002523]
MNEAPRRFDPTTDRATAAFMLGCLPDQVGSCPRCQGLTQRYGPGSQVVCRACRAAEASANGTEGAAPRA